MTEPRYRQIENEVKKRIAAGTYSPGSQIPTEKALAAEFNVSLITSKRALSELADAGLIVRRRGAGSFVKKQVQPAAPSKPAIPLRHYYLDDALPFLWSTLHSAVLPAHRWHSLKETLPPTSGKAPVVLISPTLPTEKIYSLSNKDIPFMVGTTSRQPLPFPQVSFANDQAAALIQEVVQVAPAAGPLPLFYDDTGDTPLADQASAQARFISMTQAFGAAHDVPSTEPTAGVYVFNQARRAVAFAAKQKRADTQRVYLFLISYLPATSASQLQQDLLPWGIQILNFDWTALLMATAQWPGTAQPWHREISPRFVTGG
ncbi:GntR family transcriptional regulator [Schleiferilactobacillus shenzhenensis]|uniref:HutC n=1 Tax=Schleiferilactobacillus shenzhenensis LY-73 TaxID=1231336 RepID=U4TNT4_9LACO|nr:GntR family transcriptional regulator [Schleiferilactobacillus shenzhenensis]ERL66551.1 HutC [Schleiferilactobacillus shenzhenensis LY-73]